MKKLFTLTLSLLFALSAAAQATDTSVQFADKDGNIIADGSTLNLTAYESDFFGDIMVHQACLLKTQQTRRFVLPQITPLLPCLRVAHSRFVFLRIV